MASRNYARALRIVAGVIAAVALAKHLAGDFPDAAAERDLLIVRGSAAGLALVIAALSTPRRSVGQLQRLAFALGLDVALWCCGAVVVVPLQIWEQAGSLIGMMFGAAVFLPWPWRWQSSLVTATLVVATVTVLFLVPGGDLPGHSAARALVTLYAMGALSIVGANLADRARRHVAASEAQYRGIFEGSSDGIALLNGDGLIREANPRLAELLGRPLADIVGTPLRRFYAPDQVLVGEHAAAQRGELRHASRTLVKPDGRTVHVEIAFSPVPGPEGGETMVLANFRDRTERRAEEHREMQEARLDSMARLSGALAHQYNNILGGILTHAGVLHDEVTSPDARTAADEVLKGARRGRELTKELLGLSRPETVTVRPASAAALIDSAAALARAALPAGVDVQIDVPADLPNIAADVDQVVHVCLELVFNARDALRGRPSPRVTFAAAPETVAQGSHLWPGAVPGHYVRISISDNGRGMDPAIADRVFDPFFSTKPMHEAKGLGLAEVHRVMKEHRGAVRLESALGQGTTVHLLLPLASESSRATPVPPLPAGERGSGGEGSAGERGPGGEGSAPAQTGATILVVDDEAIVRNSLKRALTRFGYRVLEAGDGGSALTTMQAADPPVDLIILDLVLPGGGAGIFELLKAVRPDVRVLISSGYSPDADAARGLADRVEGFLPKPYELGQLRTAVTQALSGTA
jgi:two-component system cell cycle sensor histidine kinase/response regulator CckA